MKRRMTHTQAYEELTKLTLRHGIADMNRIMYEKFKKRRVDLLDVNQTIALLEALEELYNHKGKS